MALSIDSIYRPVSDFLLKKFNAGPQSPIFFRFDRAGCVISDGDFAADSGADPQETFSDIVNEIPVEDADGLNVAFGANPIDSEYHWLLSSALPNVDPAHPDKEAILETFSRMKADAMREWERLSLARSNKAIPGYYRPCLGFPSNWYDPGAQVWSGHSFEVKEAETTAPPESPKHQMWKLKLADEHLAQVLPVLASPEPVQPAAVVREAAIRRPVPARIGFMRAVVRDHRAGVAAPAVVAPPTPAVAFRRHRAFPVAIVRDHRVGAPALHGHVAAAVTPATPAVNLRANLHRLHLTSRLPVLRYIRENAPTQPTTTSIVRIAFDYCTVQIRRLWMTDFLTRNRSWYIPGCAKGQESAPGAEMKFSALPVGFLAIKNLSIEANWSDVDIELSKNATDFGPFEVKSEIVDNRLSHPGIQIIGWLLQRMPDLPPTDPPAPVPAPA